MDELKFDYTNKNFQSFVDSEYDTEAVFFLQIDIINACGQIAKNLTYHKDDTQIQLCKKTAVALLETIADIESGKIPIQYEEDN